MIEQTYKKLFEVMADKHGKTLSNDTDVMNFYNKICKLGGVMFDIEAQKQEFYKRSIGISNEFEKSVHKVDRLTLLLIVATTTDMRIPEEAQFHLKKLAHELGIKFKFDEDDKLVLEFDGIREIEERQSNAADIMSSQSQPKQPQSDLRCISKV